VRERVSACVLVNVCERDRKRKRERQKGGERERRGGRREGGGGGWVAYTTPPGGGIGLTQETVPGRCQLSLSESFFSWVWESLSFFLGVSIHNLITGFNGWCAPD